MKQIQIKNFKHLCSLVADAYKTNYGDGYMKKSNIVLKNTHFGTYETVDGAIDSIVWYWAPDMQEFIDDEEVTHVKSNLDIYNILAKEYVFWK